MAVSAYVLIEVTPKKVKDVLKGISNVEGVKSAHAVTGPYDVIANIEGDDVEAVGKLVTEKIQDIKGVTRTITCVAVDIG